MNKNMPAPSWPDQRQEVADLRAERDEWVIERAVGQQQLDALVNENRALRAIYARIEEAAADARRVRPSLDDIQSDGSERAARDPAPVHSREGRTPDKPKPQPAARPVQGVTAGETATGVLGGLARRFLDEIEAGCEARNLVAGTKWIDGVSEGIQSIERMLCERQWSAMIDAALNGERDGG